jgi:hypothetical protein
MTCFSQNVAESVNAQENQQKMDYIASEFNEEMLRTILLLNARLMALSMDDMKSVVISIVSRENAQLMMKRDESGIELKVKN